MKFKRESYDNNHITRIILQESYYKNYITRIILQDVQNNN